jgi:hypothetical protein
MAVNILRGHWDFIICQEEALCWLWSPSAPWSSLVCFLSYFYDFIFPTGIIVLPYYVMLPFSLWFMQKITLFYNPIDDRQYFIHYSFLKWIGVNIVKKNMMLSCPKLLSTLTIVTSCRMSQICINRLISTWKYTGL